MKLNCREMIEFLMDYLDGTLPAEQQGAFCAHLRVCPDCVTFMKTYEATIAVGKKSCSCDDEIPAAVPEELVRAILAARQTPPAKEP